MAYKGENLSADDAKNNFVDLYRVFLKFINNDQEIKMMYCDPFDLEKVDVVHANTMKQYKKLDDVCDEAYVKRDKAMEEIERLLILKSHHLIRKDITNRLISLYDIVKFYDNISCDKDEFQFCDYYFSYNGKYYTIDMSSDIEDFGYVIPNPDGNLLCCHLREYENFIEFHDTSRFINILFDKNTKRLKDILNVTKYYLDEYDNSYYRSNSNIECPRF